MKRITRNLIFGLICLLLGCTAALFFVVNITNKSEDPFIMANIQKLSDVPGVVKQIKVRDVLLNSISQEAELVILQTELKNEIQVDLSPNEWDILKKKQNMVFYGFCKYSTDLSGFTADDIFFNRGKNIVVKVPNPVISSLEIDEEETIIANTENGLFRFGEIKTTAFDQNEIRKAVKDNLLLDAGSEEMLEKAQSSTIEVVEELVSNILLSAGFENYTVAVELYDPEIKLEFDPI